MKQGRTLQELATELERQAKSKRDFVADTRALTAWYHENDGLQMSVEGLGHFAPTDIFHDQIGQHYGIPQKYYDKMRAQAPALLTSNLNHWLKNEPTKRMVRTLDGNARAFLSDRYRPLDNYDLAEIVLPKLTDMECRIESCDLTEKRLYIKAVTPRITGEVSVGDTVQSGVCISNSEVGCGSLTVEFLMYRLSCRNGAIHAGSMRKYHVGRKNSQDIDWAAEFFSNETRKADDKAFWLKVQDLVSATMSKEGFEKIIAQYRRAQSMKIEADPVKAVEIFSEKLVLGETEQHGVLRHLTEGGDLSLYGLMNAVTRFAQDVKNYDRATELERIGGAVVELAGKDWEEIATAK